MVRPQALMEAVSANPNWFLQPIGENLSKPQKKFLRDGSTGHLVNGYWLIELYASVSRKNSVPILLEPFSHEQPLCPGQNPIILDAAHWVFELTEKRGAGDGPRRGRQGVAGGLDRP